MFPLTKLGELPPRTRLRKISRILQSLEVGLMGGAPPDPDYLARLAELANDAANRRMGSPLLPSGLASLPPAALLRALNQARHDILRELGSEPAEWDLVAPETGRLDRSQVTVRPLAVYLEDLRSPYNVGSIFRTAEAFGVQRVLLSPRTPLPTHPRAERTARGAGQAIPWETADLDRVRGETGVFALEVGGTPLERFPFPGRGLVLVGSEELGLSPEALSLADASSGRVSIPMAGAKRSLNVAVAFGILMHAWYASVTQG